LGRGIFSVRHDGGEFSECLYPSDAEGGKRGITAVALSALSVCNPLVFEPAAVDVVIFEGALSELQGSDIREVFFC
jgi:hypothetical protein